MKKIYLIAFVIFPCFLFSQKSEKGNGEKWKRIAVIVNKNWEVEPIINAIFSSGLKPNDFPDSFKINRPMIKKDTMTIPRASIYFDNSVYAKKEGKDIPNLCIVIYCIQDLMFINSPLSAGLRSTSSSAEKDLVLNKLFKEVLTDVDLVLAVGTAGMPTDGFSMAGSVTVGSVFYMCNGNSSNPKSTYQSKYFGEVLKSNVNPDLFDPQKGIFNPLFIAITASKFLKVPSHPAENMKCIASPSYCAVSFVNVTNYAEYGWADIEAVEDYMDATKRQPNSKDTTHRCPIGSIETTHGIIKANTNAPIIFVSAITDNFGNFSSEVNSLQNYTASFNAGIVLGQMFCSLNGMVRLGVRFNK